MANICVSIYECYVYIPVTNMGLSFFRHTNKLKKTHHLIVVECGCMIEFVGGIIHLAQIPKNIVQIF